MSFIPRFSKKVFLFQLNGFVLTVKIFLFGLVVFD